MSGAKRANAAPGGSSDAHGDAKRPVIVVPELLAHPSLFDVAWLVVNAGFGQDILSALVATSSDLYNDERLMEGPFGLANVVYHGAPTIDGDVRCHTRLMHAAMLGNTERVSELLRHLAPIDRSAPCDRALPLAIAEGHAQTALTLVAAGANVFAAFSGRAGDHPGILKEKEVPMSRFLATIRSVAPTSAFPATPLQLLLTGIKSESVPLIEESIAAGVAEPEPGAGAAGSYFDEVTSEFFVDFDLSCGDPTDCTKTVLAAKAFSKHPHFRFPANLRLASRLAGRRSFDGDVVAFEWIRELCTVPDLPGGHADAILWAASCAGHADIVLAQLRLGANPMASFDDESAICKAAQKGHRGVVGVLVDAVVEGGNQEHLDWALIAASAVGSLVSVSKLLENNASPLFFAVYPHGDRYGEYAAASLNEAVAGCFVDVAEELFHHGGEFYPASSVVQLLKKHSTEVGVTMARLLSSYDVLLPEVEFRYLVLDGDDLLVAAFIEGGQDVNAESFTIHFYPTSGHFRPVALTPLFALCLFFREDEEVAMGMLRRLCAAGANLDVHLEGGTDVSFHSGDVRDAAISGGSTPLIVAVCNKNVELVQELCSLGASLTETCAGGHTPLFYARSGGFAEIEAVLLAAGSPEEGEEPGAGGGGL